MTNKVEELFLNPTVRKFRTVQTEKLAFDPTIRKFRIVRQEGTEIGVRREEESTCSILEQVCKESLHTSPHGANAGKNRTKNPKRLIISILNRNIQ